MPTPEQVELLGLHARIVPRSYNPAGLAVKRLVDLLGSAVLLALLSPLFLILAIAVKLDSPGPVFFRRRVAGRHGEPYTVYKFRSMVTNAHELLLSDPKLRRQYEEALKIDNDPRITRVGAFLRRTSLDELPQLYNVFRGTMSLVGPRMLGDIELARYGQHAGTVLQVKPGMAGLWAVNGRHTTSLDDRIDMDRQYVELWSLWLDFKILCKCVFAVISMVGAK